MHEIDAVNLMLRAVGDPTVAQLDPSSQRSEMARDTLARQRRRILTNGYSFNTDRITLSPDTGGKVPVAKSYLKVMLPQHLSIRRDGGTLYLWDQQQSRWWAKKVGRVGVVFDIEHFDDIPDPFALWIAHEAAAEFWKNINQGPAPHLQQQAVRQMALAINSDHPTNLLRLHGRWIIT